MSSAKLNVCLAWVCLSSWDNSIGTVDLVYANKTDALAFTAGTGPAPARFAKVIINHYATDEPYLMEYVVGPLPITEKATYHEASFYTTKGEAKIRSYAADDDLLYDWAMGKVESMKDVIEELTNQTWDSLDYWGIDPLWMEGSRVVTWWGSWAVPSNVFDGETLLPQGVYFKVSRDQKFSLRWCFS